MQQQQEPQAFDIRTGFSIFHYLTAAHAMAILPFIRKDFGREFFGMPALGSAVMMVALAGEDGIMMTYFYAWLGMLAIHRVRALQAERKRNAQHSRYSGWPWLGFMVPFTKGEVSAKAGEVIPLVLIGAALCPMSETLGGFVLMGIVSIPCSTAINLRIEETRARNMRDRMIEGRQLARRVRGDF